MQSNNNSYRKLNPSQHVFELYLFVNPIGLKCLNSEHEVLHFIESLELNEGFKVHFRFLTFHNFSTVTQYMKRLNMPTNDLQLRNHIYETIYEASLAYKAALMQGKKRGRKFLMLLQKELNINMAEYSSDLLIEVAKGANLDVEMFLEDKASSFVKSSYDADQKIAQEMNISNNPSLVIFDNFNQQFGVLLEDVINCELIEKAFNHANSLDHQSQMPHQKKARSVGKSYLQIIK